ncbi:MAG: PAS domain S-box protein [Nitrospirae bacterium]|nr:PAS domain S-box protein [Nitrospirota bacterium]
MRRRLAESEGPGMIPGECADSAKEGHERLTSVLDSMNEVVYVADMTTHEILYANKAAYDVFGDLPGRICWQTLQTGKSGPCAFCTNDKLVDADGNPSGVYVWEFQNTRTGLWYSVRDKAIKWLDGRIVRLEIAADITAQKRTEESLRKSEALLRAMGKMAKVGGWEFDVATLKQVWTEEIYEITEVGPDYEPTVSKSIAFYANEARPAVAQAVQRAIDKGEPFDLVVPLITAKGNRRWVHAIGEAQQSNGKTTKVFGTFQDVTDRKMVEVNLEEKNAALREVFAQLEIEKNNLHANLKANIERLIMPTLKILHSRKIFPEYINLLQRNIEEIAHSFGVKISKPGLNLSPKEIEICALINKGYTNKEISDFLNSSVQTVEKHRKNVRKKMGITHKKINLRTYLQHL